MMHLTIEHAYRAVNPFSKTPRSWADSGFGDSKINGYQVRLTVFLPTWKGWLLLVRLVPTYLVAARLRFKMRRSMRAS